MKQKYALLMPIMLGAAFSAPAFATCTPPTEVVLPAANIILVSPKGKSLVRTTGADGILQLKGLRKGAWQVRLADENTSVTMHVSGNGKLSIKSVTVSYSCSAPGGPVNHVQSQSLKQLNKPQNP